MSNPIEFDSRKAIEKFISQRYRGDACKQGEILRARLDDWSLRERPFWDLLGEVLLAYENERVSTRNGNASIWPRVDDSDFKRSVPQLVAKYLELPSLHCPRVDDFLCVALLDSELYPLAREMNDPKYVLGSTGGPGVAIAIFAAWWPFRIVAWVLNFALLGLGVLAWSHGYIWLSVGLAALFCWNVALGVWRTRKVRRAVFEFSQKLRSIHVGLTQARDEISSGAYDRRVVTQRLKELEANGAYVPSILYSLLRIAH